MKDIESEPWQWQFPPCGKFVPTDFDTRTDQVLKIAEDARYPNAVCPHCEAALDVEDPDDFQERFGQWEREEDHEMLCPVCDEYMVVRVSWSPTYLDTAWR